VNQETQHKVWAESDDKALNEKPKKKKKQTKRKEKPNARGEKDPADTEGWEDHSPAIRTQEPSRHSPRIEKQHAFLLLSGPICQRQPAGPFRLVDLPLSKPQRFGLLSRTSQTKVSI
jgi:hypothetical protein